MWPLAPQIAQSPHSSRRKADGRVPQAAAKASRAGRCLLGGKRSLTVGALLVASRPFGLGWCWGSGRRVQGWQNALERVRGGVAPKTGKLFVAQLNPLRNGENSPDRYGLVLCR